MRERSHTPDGDALPEALGGGCVTASPAGIRASVSRGINPPPGDADRVSHVDAQEAGEHEIERRPRDRIAARQVDAVEAKGAAVRRQRLRA